jgi:hypothetical protein
LRKFFLRNCVFDAYDAITPNKRQLDAFALP